MGAEDKRSRVLGIVDQLLPDHKAQVRGQFVTHPVAQQEGVPVLREHGRFEGDREFGFVDQFVGGVPQQSVAGVVAGHLGDVQLLLLAVRYQTPSSTRSPTAPA